MIWASLPASSNMAHDLARVGYHQSPGDRAGDPFPDLFSVNGRDRHDLDGAVRDETLVCVVEVLRLQHGLFGLDMLFFRQKEHEAARNTLEDAGVEMGRLKHALLQIGRA